MTYIKPENRATCHPEKKIHAKGLCATCYWKSTYHKTGSLAARNKRYLKEYGITLDQYNDMLSRCNFRCEICGEQHREEQWKRLCVDHNHATNEVRGLLCDDCNQALGRTKENPAIILGLIGYLDKYKTKLL